MKLGVTPRENGVVTRLDPAQLVRLRRMGCDCLGLVFPDDLDEVSGAALDRARGLLADNGLGVAQIWIVGGTTIFSPDPEKVAADHRRVRKALELCGRLDCPALVIAPGTYNGPFGPHPLNETEKGVDEVIRCARQLVPAAADAGVYLAMEPLTLSIVRSAQRIRRIVDEVGSDWLGVNLDPVNLMTFDNVYHMTDAVNEMFGLLGEHIVSSHAKDGYLESGVLIHLSECLCGTGLMDWRTFLRRYSRLAPWKAVVLEHTLEPDVPAALQHLQECAAAEGLTGGSAQSPVQRGS